MVSRCEPLDFRPQWVLFGTRNDGKASSKPWQEFHLLKERNSHMDTACTLPKAILGEVTPPLGPVPQLGIHTPKTSNNLFFSVRPEAGALASGHDRPSASCAFMPRDASKAPTLEQDAKTKTPKESKTTS